MTNSTPSAASRLASARDPAAESSPPTPGVSTIVSPVASSRRGSPIETRDSPRRLSGLPRSLARLAGSSNAGDGPPSRSAMADSALTVSSSVYPTSIGTTVA